MAEDLLFQKLYGCILGSVIGETLGTPLEEIGDFREIEKRHGKVTDFIKTPDVWGDDSEYMELYCSTYIRKDARISPEDMAVTWLHEASFDKMFFCLQTSMELVKNGTSARHSGSGNFVTGSAIMGIAPVGMFHSCNPADAYVDAMELSYMHQRGLDAEAAAVYAACIASAMKPGATVDSVVETAIAFSSDAPMVIFDTRIKETFRGIIRKAVDIASKYTDVFEARAELVEKCTQWHQLDPLEVLTLTLAVFRVAGGDPTNSIVGGANIGRDADTIASLCGALSGALKGCTWLPKHMGDKIERNSDFKFSKLATKMWEVINSNKTYLMRQVSEYEQWTKVKVEK